jgi:hypothetical protein
MAPPVWLDQNGRPLPTRSCRRCSAHGRPCANRADHELVRAWRGVAAVPVGPADGVGAVSVFPELEAFYLAHPGASRPRRPRRQRHGSYATRLRGVDGVPVWGADRPLGDGGGGGGRPAAVAVVGR